MARFVTLRFGRRKDRVMAGRQSLARLADDRQVGEDLDPWSLRLDEVETWHGEDLWERSSLPTDLPPARGYRVRDAETDELLGLVLLARPGTRYVSYRELYGGVAHEAPALIDPDTTVTGAWLHVDGEARVSWDWSTLDGALVDMIKPRRRRHRALPPQHDPGPPMAADDDAALGGL